MPRGQPTAFGQLVRTELARQGLTQGELARAVGIQPETLSRVITGARRPSAALVLSISTALQLSPHGRDAALRTAGYERGTQELQPALNAGPRRSPPAMGERQHCIYCFRFFQLHEAEIISNLDHRVIRGPSSQGLVSSMLHKILRTERYLQEPASIRCPHCSQLISSDLFLNPTIVIGIAGAPGSGKSTYLATIIHTMLVDSTLLDLGATYFYESDTNTRKVERSSYLNPLFSSHYVLPATPRAQLYSTSGLHPLVYALGLRNNSGETSAVNLVFYDGSGEDMMSIDNLMLFSQFLLNASGIVLLFDPLMLPRISAFYSKASTDPQLHDNAYFWSDNDPSTILHQMMAAYWKFHGIQGSSKVHVPIAVTISKADLFDQAKAVLPEDLSRTYKDLGLTSEASPTDYVKEWQSSGWLSTDLWSRAVISNEYSNRYIRTIETNFTNHAFFAVSSTGSAPRADGYYHRLEPRRCLEPILWILSVLGLISPASDEVLP